MATQSQSQTQTPMTSSNYFGQEDQYTDYSCSTPLERLSRDVETVLRAWHIDQGCDHHVSLMSHNNASGVGVGGSGATRTAAAATTTLPGDDPTSPLIRSHTITWHVPVVTRQQGRSTVTLDLELALWDAPGSSSQGGGGFSDLSDCPLPETTTAAAGTSGSYHGSSTGTTSTLVKSLQRTAFGKMHVHDYLFDNLARLFGIGQHLSLSPIHPEPLPQDLIDFVAGNLLERHDPSITTPLVLSSTLTQWLQSALQMATSNSMCAIPAFGIWGQYRPNELLAPNHAISLPITTTTATSSTSGGAGETTSLTAGQSPADLLGRTIQTEQQQQQQQHTQDGGMTVTSATTTGTTTTTATTTTRRSAPPKGISVFPKWAQALQHAQLPSVSRAYQRRAHFHWNAHYLPPLICGQVTGNLGPTPLDTPSTAATCWVSAVPGELQHATTSKSTNSQQQQQQQLHHAMTAATTTSCRLSLWASVLQQHCPPEDAGMVVLHGARHVFGWFKATPQEASKHVLFGSLNAKFIATLQEWRNLNAVLLKTPKPGDSEFDLYRKHCQAHAMDLLEDAWKGGANTAKFHAHTNHGHHMDYYEYQQSKTTTTTPSPVWGPLDDPVASVYATTTWSCKITNDAICEPLLTFPIQIKSAKSGKTSNKDWKEMEESVERAILDPLSPSRFVVQVYYDRETDVSTLAANQRCVLAALIRAATLPGETLLSHLTDTQLVALWDDEAGTRVATKLAAQSKCGSATTRIVQAMDWSNIMQDMIPVEQAKGIVHAVMSGELTAGFPTSPEETFLEAQDLCQPFRKAAPFGRLLSLLFAHMAKLRALSSISLVWSVFCDELRRRWDARESLPNMQYVAGLDPHPLQLYEQRCFTSMGHQASFSAFLNCSEPDPDDYHCLIGQKLQVVQVGIECVVAKELLEQEVMERFLEQGEIPATARMAEEDLAPGMIQSEDPSEEEDSKWKPVGSDKVSSVVVPEIAPSSDEAPPMVIAGGSGYNKKSKRKWPKSKAKKKGADETTGARQDYGPPTINSDLEFWVMDEPGHAPLDIASQQQKTSQHVAMTTDDTGFDYVMSAPKDMEDLDADESVSYRRKSSMMGTHIDMTGWEGTIMEDRDSQGEDEDDDSEGSGDSAASRTTSASMSQAYFDAAEAGSIFSMKHGFVTLDTVVNVADMKRRPGARCPVHQVTLKGTGDQLYAPYLQRPAPLTDDLVMERKHMLASEQRQGESRKAVLEARIKLAHRLQRPKLLSDMSAFKAANPNSTIDDFTRWYGNPGSPLDDYDEPLPDDVSVSGAYYESAAKKLDRASEAMKVLVATRDFWATTWEQAPAVPASEQQPLFNYESTVEMAIDYLEQIHPANLVNQIMAVNLASSYFTLMTSAEDALNVGVVKATVLKLRRKINHALGLLSSDATGSLFDSSDTASTSTATANQYISEEAIHACEEACNAVALTETMLARAISLLSKFPSQYRLVQELIKLSDGTTVGLNDTMGRRGFLSAIYQQQKLRLDSRRGGIVDGVPEPVLREYVLRNLDDEKPCQLAVRFGDAGAYLGRVENEGGVLLAITKSFTD